MQKVPPPASSDAYVADMTGWRRTLVTHLRTAALSVGGVDEVIKWGHRLIQRATLVGKLRPSASAIPCWDNRKTASRW